MSRLRRHTLCTALNVLVAVLVLSGCTQPDAGIAANNVDANNVDANLPSGGFVTGYGLNPTLAISSSPTAEGDAGDTLVDVTISLVPRSYGVLHVDYVMYAVSAYGTDLVLV